MVFWHAPLSIFITHAGYVESFKALCHVFLQSDKYQAMLSFHTTCLCCCYAPRLWWIHLWSHLLKCSDGPIQYLPTHSYGSCYPKARIHLKFWFEIDGLCWRKVLMLMPKQQAHRWQNVVTFASHDKLTIDKRSLCFIGPTLFGNSIFVRKKMFCLRPWPLDAWFKRLVLGDEFVAFACNVLTNDSKVPWWNIWNDMTSCLVQVS